MTHRKRPFYLLRLSSLMTTLLAVLFAIAIALTRLIDAPVCVTLARYNQPQPIYVDTASHAVVSNAIGPINTPVSGHIPSGQSLSIRTFPSKNQTPPGQLWLTRRAPADSNAREVKLLSQTLLEETVIGPLNEWYSGMRTLWNPDGTRLLYSLQDTNGHVWLTRYQTEKQQKFTVELERAENTSFDTIRLLDWSASEQYFTIADVDGTHIRAFNTLAVQEEVPPLAAHGWAPTGDQLAGIIREAGIAQYSLVLWSPGTLRKIPVAAENQYIFQSVLWSPDGASFAVQYTRLCSPDEKCQGNARFQYDLYDKNGQTIASALSGSVVSGLGGQDPFTSERYLQMRWSVDGKQFLYFDRSGTDNTLNILRSYHLNTRTLATLASRIPHTMTRTIFPFHKEYSYPYNPLILMPVGTVLLPTFQDNKYGLEVLDLISEKRTTIIDSQADQLEEVRGSYSPRDTYWDASQTLVYATWRTVAPEPQVWLSILHLDGSPVKQIRLSAAWPTQLQPVYDEATPDSIHWAATIGIDGQNKPVLNIFDLDTGTNILQFSPPIPFDNWAISLDSARKTASIGFMDSVNTAGPQGVLYKLDLNTMMLTLVSDHYFTDGIIDPRYTIYIERAAEGRYFVRLIRPGEQDSQAYPLDVSHGNNFYFTHVLQPCRVAPGDY